jgi:flagellar biosynthetic protein FliP
LLVGSGWILLFSGQTGAVEGPSPEDPRQGTQAKRQTPENEGHGTKVPAGVAALFDDPNAAPLMNGGLGNSELFLKMLFSVVLVLGLGGAALYLSKKVLPRVTQASGKEIHILETAYLGPRKALHLVEVGDRRLLLASTNDAITMLAPVGEAWEGPAPDVGTETPATGDWGFPTQTSALGGPLADVKGAVPCVALMLVFLLAWTPAAPGQTTRPLQPPVLGTPTQASALGGPLPQVTPTPLTSPASAPISVPTLTDLVTVLDKATSAAPESKDWSTPIKLVIIFGGLALLPSLLVMMTSFTRIIIVLAFVRRALTTQSIPPTVAIIGLALFLTLYTMAPTYSQVNAQAIQPYLADQVPLTIAVQKATGCVKEFMLRQSRKNDLTLFVQMAKIPPPSRPTDLGLHIVVPAFVISEFRTAFEIGCLLFIPFLLIDMVIASVLLSAGMIMLPPVMISLPFKLILFILVDGWGLLAKSLSLGFR